MIEGERGQAIFDQVIAQRMDALLDGDQLSATLLGACIADALRKGETPREIALRLWEGLPDDDAWATGMREKIETAIEQFEEGMTS